jgi:Raf kinase inhibitor-like YbhB/YbcL family protein
MPIFTHIVHLPAMPLWRRTSTHISAGILLFSLLTACSLQPTSNNAAQASNTTTFHPFTISSPDFKDGGPLPQRVASPGQCTGSNVAPTLQWTNAPTGTQSFALLMSDYDAALAGGVRHWIVYNIPANVHQLQGNQPYTEGTNSGGHMAYMGPCPPANGEPHHYLFLLYALDVANIGQAGLHYDNVINAAQGHVKGATSMIGIFHLPQ